MKKATVNFLSSMVIFGTIGLFVDAIPLNSGVIALFRGIMGLVFLLLVTVLLMGCYGIGYNASDFIYNQF
jgi:hypothetical protein